MTSDIMDWSAIGREWQVNPPVLLLVQGDIKKEVRRDLRVHARGAKGRDLLIFIDSGGGDAGVAEEAHERSFPLVRKQGGRVVTVVLGEASSAASHLLVGGDKGARFALPGAKVGLHGGTVTAWGEQWSYQAEVDRLCKRIRRRKPGWEMACDMVRMAYVSRTLKTMNQRQVAHYHACTGLTWGALETACATPDFTIFDAQQALDAGMVDGIGLPDPVRTELEKVAAELHFPVAGQAVSPSRT